MSSAYSLYFGMPIGPNASRDINSENPIMALSGVRSSWVMFATNRPFDRLASSATRAASRMRPTIIAQTKPRMMNTMITATPISKSTASRLPQTGFRAGTCPTSRKTGWTRPRTHEGRIAVRDECGAQAHEPEIVCERCQCRRPTPVQTPERIQAVPGGERISLFTAMGETATRCGLPPMLIVPPTDLNTPDRQLRMTD